MKEINKDLFTVLPDGFTVKLSKHYSAVFGLGEKFDNVNQKGKFVRACVREKCFYQGEYTYLSMPFFFTPDGFGLYVDTYAEVDFDFTKEGEITVFCHRQTNGLIPSTYLLEGTPKEIICQFKKLTGMPRLFPKWVLGSWMSSNRWQSQDDVENQLDLTDEHGFPHNVLVIERWSDLTTHYIWDGMTVPFKKGDEYIKPEEMDFSNSQNWKDPKSMIDRMHNMEIKLLVWIVPIYAQDINIEGRDNIEQCLSDNRFAKDNKECVLNHDGTPYEIPHTWCIGSMIPDFTDPIGKKHWFDRFSYLLDLGIDGFKTDGGEFVHEKTVRFKDGTSGIEGQNAYAEQYTKAFAEFVGDDRIVFSRAGGPKSSGFSVIWAGDQESTWSEYRSVIKAGISAGASGISCWGYDIAGFSGYLPTAELYLRATQTASFLPIMQWHSDPVTNNRCDFSGAWTNNDRSPWNISQFHKDPNLLALVKKQFLLHYNLIPYQYNLMLNSHVNGVSAIRPLAVEFYNDENTYNIEDQFMLGESLLVAPIIDDYIEERQVYLPKGVWYDFFTGEKYCGGWNTIKIVKDYCPCFMRDNSVVPLNLNGGKLFSDVGNHLDCYKELTFLVSGKGQYDFKDDLGNQITVCWDENTETVISNKKNLPVHFLRMGKDKLI